MRHFRGLARVGLVILGRDADDQLTARATTQTVHNAGQQTPSAGAPRHHRGRNPPKRPARFNMVARRGRMVHLAPRRQARHPPLSPDQAALPGMSPTARAYPLHPHRSS
ncbi:hypothetical protein ACU686_26280 [Yinghuangia aomiensis]